MFDQARDGPGESKLPGAANTPGKLGRHGNILFGRGRCLDLDVGIDVGRVVGAAEQAPAEQQEQHDQHRDEQNDREDRAAATADALGGDDLV